MSLSICEFYFREIYSRKKQRDLLVRKYILALLKEAKTRGKRDPQLVFGKQTNEMQLNYAGTNHAAAKLLPHKCMALYIISKPSIA